MHEFSLCIGGAEMDTYGGYKRVRDAAWEILFDHHVTCLPVDLRRIVRECGIKIATYEKGERIIQSLGLEHLRVNDGFTIYVKNQWIIFYNSNNASRRRIRFSIAHELGHIFLNHKMLSTNSIFGTIFYTHENIREEDKTILEQEADMFAIRLLAPLCVLMDVNIRSPQKIMQLCDIPYHLATIRARRLSKVRKRNMIGSHPLERQVIEQFKPFVQQIRQRQ